MSIPLHLLALSPPPHYTRELYAAQNAAQMEYLAGFLDSSALHFRIVMPRGKEAGKVVMTVEHVAIEHVVEEHVRRYLQAARAVEAKGAGSHVAGVS